MLSAYPVESGKKFISAYELVPFYSTIIGVNQTVETEFKTFTNVIKVTTDEGEKYYLLEGFAVVKRIEPNAITSIELMAVE